MATMPVRINLLDVVFVQRILFAAYDLLEAVEAADPMLVTDEIVEAAAELRKAAESDR